MAYYKYKDILFHTAIARESLDAIPKYTVRDDDTFIVTYPKTGTNWILEIVNKVLQADGKIQVPEDHTTWCFELTTPGMDEKPRHVLAMDKLSPRFIHTHLPYNLAPEMVRNPKEKVKVIVVMRNPKDVVVSYYHYQRTMDNAFPGEHLETLDSWDKYASAFLEGKGLYGDFYDHVLGWWKMRDDPHFLFLKYEDMLKDPNGTVRTVAAFLDATVDGDTTTNIAESCAFDRLKAEYVQSSVMKKFICRKGIIGDWKSMFTAEQNKTYDAEYKKRLEGTGLAFDFE